MIYGVSGISALKPGTLAPKPRSLAPDLGWAAGFEGHFLAKHVEFEADASKTQAKPLVSVKKPSETLDFACGTCKI